MIPLRTTAHEPVLVEAPARGDARAVLLPHGPEAVPLARRQLIADVAARLGRDPLDDVVGDAGIVASELLGNAVLHAAPLAEGGIHLRWQVRDDVVDVEVTDGGGPTAVRPARPAPFAVHGRGLRIVRSLAHEWGVQEEPDGRRTVWAAIGGPSRRRRAA